MPKVLGWSSSSFSSKNIGTLFPKKEWWIDSISTEQTVSIWRGTVGGSRLEDHRARQIRRSLEEAGIQMSELIQGLAENKPIVAVCEHATIDLIPDKAQGVEWRSNLQVGQPLNSWLARWQLVCHSVEELELALSLGAQVFLVNPTVREENEEWSSLFPPAFGSERRPPYTCEELCQSTHRLLGERAHKADKSRYLADAIWDIVPHCEAVLLLHADKHGECLGIYSAEKIDLQQRLSSLVEHKDIVLIPFSIPIMNGRWNRSVRDFLRRWDSEQGEFPIPVFQQEEEDSIQEEDGESMEESEEDNSEEEA